MGIGELIWAGMHRPIRRSVSAANRAENPRNPAAVRRMSHRGGIGVGYTKVNPGKVSMASGGNGSPSHVTGELFKMMAGVDNSLRPFGVRSRL